MKLIFLIVSCFLVAGCISPNYGNQALTKDLIEQGIVPGKTTKQDLINLYGNPATISVTTGVKAVPNNLSKPDVKEVWNYYKMTKEGFSSMKSLMVGVYLDASGVVLDYVITENMP